MKIFLFKRNVPSETLPNSYFCVSKNGDPNHLFGILHSKICSADEGAPCTLERSDWTLSVSRETLSPIWQDQTIYDEKEFLAIGKPKYPYEVQAPPHEVRAESAISELNGLISKVRTLLQSGLSPEEFEYQLTQLENIATQAKTVVASDEMSVGGRIEGDRSWMVIWRPEDAGLFVPGVENSYILGFMTATPSTTRHHLIHRFNATEQDAKVQALDTVIRNWNHVAPYGWSEKVHGAVKAAFDLYSTGR